MSVIHKLPRYSVPGHCIMFPGRYHDDRGFFMFDQVLDGARGDIRVAVSAEGLRTIAMRHGARFGLALLEDLDKSRARESELDARVKELEAQVEELEAFKDRIAGLKADGFTIARKQGRPTTKRDDD